MIKKYRKLPIVIEAWTFDEFVAYGKQVCGGNIVNGMPWSFNFPTVGVISNKMFDLLHPITHETDDCYLIPTLEGTMKFNRGDMLIVGVKGEIYPCKKDIFDRTYEEVGEWNKDEMGG